MSLDKTLTEVRYAYRFIWEFQKRLLDTVKLLSEQFEDRVFYQWSNYKASPVTRTATSPFNSAPEQFLPLYGASFLYLSAETEKASLTPGNWMLEISVVPDTAHLAAFEADNPFDPLSAEFGTPESSKSIIRLIAWKCESEFPENTNWYQSTWQGLDWPKLSNEHEPLSQSDGDIMSVGISKNMSQLSDRQEIIEFATEAKAYFLSKLNLI